MSTAAILSLLITQPRKAFEELAQRPRSWVPLLVMVLVAAGTSFWYFKVADVGWLLDETLRTSPRSATMTEEQRAQAAKIMSPNVLMWVSVITVIVLLPLMRALEAAYYLLAGKITNVQRSYRQWFALGVWSNVPTLLAAIPAALVLLTTTNGQLDSSAIQPLSLNELFFHRTMGQPGYSLFTTLTLLHPLAWLLAMIGVQEWSRRSWLFSAVFVLLPVVVIYGGWAWFALR